MAKIDSTLKGQEAMQRRIDRVISRFGDRLVGALYMRAEMVMTTSKRDYVPVDLATLMNSGTVHPPQRLGNSVSISLSYGGAASAYALAVHEHPSQFSPPSWRGTVTFHPAGRGPKYLERPLMLAVSTLPQDLAADLGVDRL